MRILDIEFYVYEHFTELCVLQTLFIIYAKIMRQKIQLALLVSIFGFGSLLAQESKIIHDAEQAILQEQFGEQWATQDVEIDKKLKALEKKFGKKPGLSIVMFHETSFS